MEFPCPPTFHDQAYELVEVGELEPHPDNPREGNVDAIAESVEANGFSGAIVAQRSTGHVLAGNHRLLAARPGLGPAGERRADARSATPRRLR
jgi:hypothetical protein